MTESPDPGITIPKGIFWAALFAVIGSFGSASWFMAILFNTVSNEGIKQVVFDARLATIESRVDTNKDTVNTATGTINDRLTRIEAQLTYLVKTSSSEGRR